MDTKLKKSRKVLFGIMFCVCVVSFLTTIVGFIGALMMSGDVKVELNNDGETLFSQIANNWTLVTIGAGLAAIVSFIYLAVAVGKRNEDGEIELTRFDRVFTEVQLITIVVLFFWGGAVFLGTTQEILTIVLGVGDAFRVPVMPLPLAMAMTSLLGFAATAVSLALILSCIKKLKAREFFWQSLCGWLVHKGYYEIYMGGSLMQKVVVAAIVLCLLCATIFLAPVVLVVILVFAPKLVGKYNEIKKGVDEVNRGNLDYKIPIEGNQDGELEQLAAGINQISEATSIAMQNEVKNQRMKTDLISNVSHDLKTPITSMVTYIDLLKTEGLDSKNAPEYLDILEQKTNRLRNLTEDLFEAAKASSGAIPVRMETVDLLSLVNQGLGELNQDVAEQKLEFIITASEEHYYVNADGQLLWRVVENLIGNAIKYSQEGTRVYLEIKEVERKTVLEIKNISKQSLNIDPAELTERFKRGDESRSTEGSGLGLAIAKDLIKLMEGSIEIKIDGDLFKAIATLKTADNPAPKVPKANEEVSQEAELPVDEELPENAKN